MSSDNVVKISRNRWYRVQSRLIEEMKQVKVHVAVLSGMDLKASRHAEVDKLRYVALDKGERALQKFTMLSETLQSIRESIARTSGKVQTLMSAEVALKTRIEMYKSIVDANTAGDLVDVESCHAVANGIMSSTQAYGVRDTFKVNVVSEVRVAELSTKLKELQRDSFAIQEEIAQLNQAPLSIELSPEGARTVRELLGAE